MVSFREDSEIETVPHPPFSVWHCPMKLIHSGTLILEESASSTEFVVAWVLSVVIVPSDFSNPVWTEEVKCMLHYVRNSLDIYVEGCGTFVPKTVDSQLDLSKISPRCKYFPLVVSRLIELAVQFLWAVYSSCASGGIWGCSWPWTWTYFPVDLAVDSISVRKWNLTVCFGISLFKFILSHVSLHA